MVQNENEIINETNNKSQIAASWKRPAGPINIWRRLEADERLSDGTTKRIRISIQDIPENRYDEVIQHMLQIFISDEPLCGSFKLNACEDSKEDWRQFLLYMLKIGITVGAFKLAPDDSLLELVGVNILFVVTQEINEDISNFLANFKCNSTRKMFQFVKDISNKVDSIHKLYGVDKYISATGLSVSPAFRGQKIGLRLLEARDEIGRKYGLTVTDNIFTGPQSQKQAERAAFKTRYIQYYSETFDEDGKLLFPNIKPEAKDVKLMTKVITVKNTVDL